MVHLMESIFAGHALTGVDLLECSLLKPIYLRLSSTKHSWRQCKPTERKCPGVKLTAACLIWADLSSTDLRRARLAWADLRWATLSRADLSGATAHDALFQDASLNNANLCGAVLIAADFTGASLRAANIEGADLSKSRLINVDLSAVQGLANRKESVLSATTVVKSGWTPVELSEWLKAGAKLGHEEFAELPLDFQRAILGDRVGLSIVFDTRLTPFDRFLLDSVIFGILGPDTTCTVAEFRQDGSTATVRLVGQDHADLDLIAQLIHDRVWEAAQDSTHMTQALKLARGIATLDPVAGQTALSWLTSRGERMELWAVVDGNVVKQREWDLTPAPAKALCDFLRSAFGATEELRIFLHHLSEGRELVDRINWSAAMFIIVSAVVDELERLGMLDMEFFLHLGVNFPRREADVAYVARRWGFMLPPIVLHRV
jgi:uncharacterized protein YjbI with pentapeptide repeats